LLWPPAEHLRPCMSLSRFLMLQEELEIKPDDSHPRGFVSYCASSNYGRVSSQWNCDSRRINEPALELLIICDRGRPMYSVFS
jgi:hypothetical protein